MVYEHNNGYIPLRVKLRDVVGCYDVYNDNDKRMNFEITDELSDKIYQRFENDFEQIEEKLTITLNDFTFEKKLKATLK